MSNLKQGVVVGCFVIMLSLVSGVSKAVPDTNYKGAKEEVLDSIDFGWEETKNNDREVRETLDEAEQAVNDLMNNSIKTVDVLIDTITTGDTLSEEDKKDLRKKAGDLNRQIATIQNSAKTIIESIRKDYNANSVKVSDAYITYRKAVDNYYEGKITKSELSSQGKDFKNTVLSAKVSDKTVAIDKLLKDAEKVSKTVDVLRDDINEKIRGTGEYDDSHNQIKQNKKYVFNFHAEHTGRFLKSCFTSKSAQDSCGLFGYEGGRNRFLISKELTAVGDSTSHGAGDCKNLPDSIKEVDEDPADFVDDLRECAVRAKTESLYFCSDAHNEEELAKCDPFSMEPNFRESYKNDGVYKHIWQDYSVANIVNANQIKQFTSTWLDVKKEDESTLYKLNKAFDDIDSQNNSYNLFQQIGIESLKLLSELRRVDAAYRAKGVVDFYRQQQTLYLDGRDEDFKQAESNHPGLLEPEDPDCNSSDEDCDIKEKNIISNVVLNVCAPGLKATDISIYYRNKGDDGKIKDAEKNIKDCFYKYVEGATKGTIDNEDGGNPEEIRKEWRKKETKALTDSLFHTLALSTMNLYKSGKDYAKLDDDEINIRSLQADKESATDIRGAYGAGAKINYYGTMQLLTIIDADAQSLQSEIIRDLSKMSYNFFEKTDDEGGE